jgi:hypothetical protein
MKDESTSPYVTSSTVTLPLSVYPLLSCALSLIVQSEAVEEIGIFSVGIPSRLRASIISGTNRATLHVE